MTIKQPAFNNTFGVAVIGDKIAFPFPIPVKMEKREALEFAVMIVVLADDEHHFEEILATALAQ
jgi:hypothetical protein